MIVQEGDALFLKDAIGSGYRIRFLTTPGGVVIQHLTDGVYENEPEIFVRHGEEMYEIAMVLLNSYKSNIDKFKRQNPGITPNF